MQWGNVPDTPELPAMWPQESSLRDSATPRGGMNEGGRPGVASPQQSPPPTDLGDEWLGESSVSIDPRTDAPQKSFPALTSCLPNQIL